METKEPWKRLLYIGVVMEKKMETIIVYYIGVTTVGFGVLGFGFLVVDALNGLDTAFTSLHGFGFSTTVPRFGGTAGHARLFV